MLDSYFLKAKHYGENSNVIVIEVFLKNKTVYVKGTDKNKDRFGNEFGDFTQPYYSFMKGCKRKNNIGNELSITNEDWIEKMKKIHPEYDYSITQYVNNRKSVKIICPIHGVFNVRPKVFAKTNYKCAKCKQDDNLEKRKLDVYKKLKKIHPEYEFDLTKFKNINTKIKIICPKHGEFWQTSKNSLNNTKCPKCANEFKVLKRKKPIEVFISESQKIHGDKYDYSYVEYKNTDTKVKIICPEHGEFWQTPKSHLKSGGCPKCTKTYIRTKEDFLKDAIQIHGDKYDYSKVEYIDMNTKVCIICHKTDGINREHGEFWQTPKLHLMGYGCKKCSGYYMDTPIFIQNSQKIHGYIYDYSKVKYINTKTKVCIVCPKHGEFWQAPGSHLNGKGCPICKLPKLEVAVRNTLLENNIKHTGQKRFKKWLGGQSLDFYLPEQNIAIECQGIQHFKNDKRYKKLEEVQERDARKKRLCKENNVHLIYYVPEIFAEYMKEDDIFFTNTEDLLQYIKNYKANK